MISTLLQAYVAQTYGKALRNSNIQRISCIALIVLLLVFLMSIVQDLPSQAHAFVQDFPSQAYAPIAYDQATCSWYRIRPGDTLIGIAKAAHTDVSTLAKVNGITHVNLIFAGQQLCIPKGANGRQPAGIEPNGNVRQYAYDALEQSNYSQAKTLLRNAADYYGLPAALLLAIAWQESGWQQHVISNDGGIGMMQIMPPTAIWLNSITGLRRDPYKLKDNIFMGAFYVRYLCNTFNWNLQQVVSAYNEGAWAVTHQGIMNWHYVNNVVALSRKLQ